MKKITLKQEAAISGYDGAFLRHINADGTQGVDGLANNWYEAPATDTDGNEYRVYWEITGDLNDEDASYHCDWSKPYMVIDSAGRNVVKSVQIVDKIDEYQMRHGWIEQTGGHEVYSIAGKRVVIDWLSNSDERINVSVDGEHYCYIDIETDVEPWGAEYLDEYMRKVDAILDEIEGK